RTLKAAHVFVLMPFHMALRQIYDGPIRQACRRLKLSVERADDIFSTSEVIEDIWNAIANALIVVADCTGRNPNVFYELGMAHTLGKQVILISQKDEDVPSDIRHIRYIRYRLTAPKSLENRLFQTLRRLASEIRTV